MGYLYKQFIPLWAMGWFKKRDKVLDLTEYHNKKDTNLNSRNIKDSTINRQEKLKNNDSGGSGLFGFFSGVGKNEKADERTADFSVSEERKQKFSKKLSEMTNRIEDLSTQIYRLQQRVELLERKLEVNR